MCARGGEVVEVRKGIENVMTSALEDRKVGGEYIMIKRGELVVVGVDTGDAGELGAEGCGCGVEYEKIEGVLGGVSDSLARKAFDTCNVEIKAVRQRAAANMFEFLFLRRLACIEVVMALLDVQEKYNLMVAHELEARSTKESIKRKVFFRPARAVVLSRSKELVEASAVFDLRLDMLVAFAMFRRARLSVLPECAKLSVDVVRGDLSTISETHS